MHRKRKWSLLPLLQGGVRGHRGVSAVTMECVCQLGCVCVNMNTHIHTHTILWGLVHLSDHDEIKQTETDGRSQTSKLLNHREDSTQEVMNSSDHDCDITHTHKHTHCVAVCVCVYSAVLLLTAVCQNTQFVSHLLPACLSTCLSVCLMEGACPHSLSH